MMIQFNRDNLKKFKEYYPIEPSQGPVGRTPENMLIHALVPENQWPSQYPIGRQASRATIREICRDNMVDEKAAYVCAMAWGGMRANLLRMALKSSELVTVLAKLREGMERSNAFKILSEAWQNGQISGMRVSFFTKLPYFFLPEENAYILDQWTAKSANLLWKNCLIAMDPNNGDLPDPYTTPEQYEAYCQFVEALSEEMKWPDPVSAEIGMFGKDENGINDWRRLVKKSCSS